MIGLMNKGKCLVSISYLWLDKSYHKAYNITFILTSSLNKFKRMEKMITLLIESTTGKKGLKSFDDKPQALNWVTENKDRISDLMVLEDMSKIKKAAAILGISATALLGALNPAQASSQLYASPNSDAITMAQNADSTGGSIKSGGVNRGGINLHKDERRVSGTGNSVRTTIANKDVNQRDTNNPRAPQ